MKKLIYIFYQLFTWLILLALFVSFVLLFILEFPASFFKVLEEPLKSQGIKYGKIEGSLLSGFTVHDVNYQEKVKVKSLALKVDFKRLEQRVLYIDKLAVIGLKIEKGYLAELAEGNGTKEENNETNISLPFDQVIVNALSLSIENTSYEAYHINHAMLKVKNFEMDMKKKHKGELLFTLDSNVSKLALEGKIENNDYELKANIEGERLFFSPLLRDFNLTLVKNPILELRAKGDLKKVDFSLRTDSLDINHGAYKIETKKLLLNGYYDLDKQDIEVKLDSKLEANVAKFEINMDAFVNLDDINNSLIFDLKSTLEPKKILLENALIKKELQEQNIEIYNFPSIILLAKGDMKNVEFNTTLSQLKMRHQKIDIDLKSLKLSGETQPIVGKTKVKFLSHFDSSVAQGNLDCHASFNFKNLEKSLNFNVKTKLKAYEEYLNSFTKEHNLSIRGLTPLAVEASGSMQKLKVQVKLSSTLLYDNIDSKVGLNTEEIEIDLVKETVLGGLTLHSKAKNLAFELQSKFSGQYLNPKNLESKSSLSVLAFNAFSVNLTEFMPMDLKVNTNEQGLNVDIQAKKLELKLLSPDYNKFDFSVKSEAIYPYTIVKLPKSLKKKFIKLDLKGNLSLAEQYFTLKGLLESNKKFQANVNISSLEEGLNANIFTKELVLKVEGDLKSKELEAKVKVASLKRLQKELNTLYPFTVVNVDGSLNINAKLHGEVISATLASKKIQFKEFSINDLLIESNYEKELITINRLNFQTFGFKDTSLNQKFYLNQKGLIALGEEKKLLLDLHPKILLKAEGREKKLKALIQIEALPLGYPTYGKTKLSCDIDYTQEGEKKKVIGGVFLDKLRVFYESSFLDPSRDNDVVIVSKNKKLKELSDTFLNDTFIDVGIYTEEGKYKTKDMDLTFNVHIKAQKSFGKTLKLLGKVDEINGRVEQAPKLFTIVDSSIVFQGRKEINPLLDLTVEHELPDILITINIHGNAKRPKLTFTSEPPLPKKDILSYLLLGVSTAGLGEGKGSLEREAQLFIMNQAARDLAYEVELDRVFVKDDGTGEGYAVQVGKKVNDETMFIIENSTEGNSFILEYDVSKNIKVELGQHQKIVPSQSIDIYFRKRFK